MSCHKFHASVNGGDEIILLVGNTVYQDGAIAAVESAGAAQAARFSAVVVKIWVPDLVKSGYGPYYYRVRYRRGRLRCYGMNPLLDPAWDMMYEGDPVGGLQWIAGISS